MKYYTASMFRGANPNEQPLYATGVPFFWLNYDIEGPLSEHAKMCRDSLISATLSEDEGFSGILSMTLSGSNPCIKDLLIGSTVEVYVSDTKPVWVDNKVGLTTTSGNTLWVGRIITLSENELGNIEYTIEGAYSFLKDRIIPKNLDAVDSSQTIRYLIERWLEPRRAVQVYNGEKIPFMPPVNFALGDFPEWMDGISTLARDYSDIFEFDESTNSPHYSGESTTMYDLIKQICDFHYNNIYSNSDSSLTYTFGWHCDYIPSENMVVGYSKIKTIYIDIFEVSDFKRGFQLDETKSGTLDLTNYIKSIKKISSLDSMYTCALIEGGEDVSGNPIMSSYGLPNDTFGNTTTNGIVNGYTQVLKERGIHTGIFKADEVWGVSLSDFSQADIERIMQQLNTIYYEYDVTASEPLESDYWQSPIEIGYTYRVILPMTDPDASYVYLRCTSKKLDLLNPSKNEYYFSNRLVGIRPDNPTYTLSKDKLSIKSLSERITKLEEENAKLKSILQKGD